MRVIVVSSRGSANQAKVRYAVRNPLVGELLDVARRIFNNHFANSRGLLRELQRELRRA